jgi:hypothetical protein
VQQAQNICNYVYSVLRGQSIPNTWTCYSAEIYGQAVPMVNHRQFRYGTNTIQIVMLLNVNQDATYSILVDNLKLELISNN